MARTERRISHVYVLDAPAYPKPLIVTDAAINIAPTLAQKRDICQNAINFLHRLGVVEPLVAVLAAVETVDPAMPATLDAACLAMMAQRGQITSGKVGGPLAFDKQSVLIRRGSSRSFLRLLATRIFFLRPISKQGT